MSKKIDATEKQTQKAGIRYFQTPYSLLKEDALREQNKAGMVLALLGDRMRLSRKNGDEYYDNQEEDYYVKFSQKAMADFINASPRTVYTIYRHLDDNKYIWRKHVGYNRSDNIFLTRYAQRLLPGIVEIAKSDSQNSQPSNSEKNHRDVSHSESGSNDSVNSEHGNDELSSPDGRQEDKQSSSRKHPSSDKDKETSGKDKISLSQRIQNWRTKVHQSIGLSTDVLTSVLQVTDKNTNLSGVVIDWIKNARTNVANKHKIPFRSKKAQFETNQNLDSPLADKIKHIANAMHKKKMDIADAMRHGDKQLNACGRYVTTCLKEFFYDAFGLKFQDKVQPPMADSDTMDGSYGTVDDISGQPDISDGPDIPIFRIQ